MKRIALKLALNVLRIALRLYGWRDSRKPDGYPVSDKHWWRPKGENSIESCSFFDAIQYAIREARR